LRQRNIARFRKQCATATCIAFPIRDAKPERKNLFGDAFCASRGVCRLTRNGARGGAGIGRGDSNAADAPGFLVYILSE
jgi:hypothetical protein